MSGHRCPAPGYTEAVPSDRYACRAHWFSIPRELRDRLWMAYRYNGPLSDEHVAAMEACDEFLKGAAK